MYQSRDYRKHFFNELYWYKVQLEQSDLMIASSADYSKEALACLSKLREDILSEQERTPQFLSSLEPLEIINANEDVSAVVSAMVEASQHAGAGPSAAIAGAINDMLAKELLKYTKELLIENGGDLYMQSAKTRSVGIYAGKSVLSNRFAIQLQPEQFPCGLCTSSATVGHAYSMGMADAATVVAENSAYADAYATALCNRIKTERDIAGALQWLYSRPKVIGAVAVMNDKIGAIGNIELVEWKRYEK